MAARASDLTRDEILDAMEEIHARRGSDPQPGEADLRRIQALAEDFIARFGDGDADAPLVRLYAGEASFRLGEFERGIEDLRRYVAATPDPKRASGAQLMLGLALAERGRDAEAEAALGPAAVGLEGEARARALYALGQVRVRAGEPERAKEALEKARAATQAAALRSAIDGDLDDLARIGRPAPPADGLTAAAPSATATVIVFARKGDAAPDLEREIGALGEAVRVVRVEVEGWADPRIRAWRVPALPRVYVVDRAGIVRAAGVRGKAIAAAAAAR
jgi:tetratricopeptide (TPR) repeat protein